MKLLPSLGIAAGLSLMPSGCSDLFVGPYDLDNLTLDVAVSVAGASGSTETEFTGGPGSVAVRSVVAGQCGYELSGSLVKRLIGLELRIDAEAGLGVAITCYYRYEAVIRGVPAGAHFIRVVHDVEGFVPVEAAAATVEVR